MKHKLRLTAAAVLLALGAGSLNGHAQNAGSTVIDTASLKVIATGEGADYQFTVMDPSRSGTVLGTGSLVLSDRAVRFNLQDVNGIHVALKGISHDRKSVNLSLQAGDASAQLIASIPKGEVQQAPEAGSMDAVKEAASASPAMDQLTALFGRGKSFKGQPAVAGVFARVVRGFQKTQGIRAADSIDSCGNFARTDFAICMIDEEDPVLCFWDSVLAFISCVLY
jgi:hypothetical protein